MTVTRLWISAFVAGWLVLAALAPSASAKPDSSLPCARTTIALRRLPTGPAQYQSGSLRLTNGASMRLNGGPEVLAQVQQMRIGDPVAACYGSLTTYADAGPSRTLTVLDLRNGMYYGTLVGTWPR